MSHGVGLQDVVNVKQCGQFFCLSGSRFSSWRGDKTPITMRNMTAFFILLRTINQLMWGPSVRSEVEVATDSSFG